MNSGSVACGGLITNEGTIDVYGLASGASNPCGVTPNGLPPLNPGNVSVTCPAPSTVPATPCLPPLSSSIPSNYITGCSPSPDSTTGLPYHDSCCPASNTFSGTMSSGIYICNGPTTIDVSSQDFTVAGGSTAPNNGVLQIYVFNGTAGANDLTIQGSYGVNVNTSTSPAQNGNSEDLQIFVSNTSTPNCSPNSAGTGITGGGYIAFTTHGSNVPQISADLYAPNDSMTVSGAPFSSWVGQVLVCYASFKGGGNGKATMYSDTNKIASYTSWIVSGYKD
ncbi:MAG: hypothetical protein HKL80_03635 [Acidimicrobiales bacterium]|nr:hypothetical protein [Acidimicrobiales bacterium]